MKSTFISLSLLALTAVHAVPTKRANPGLRGSQKLIGYSDSNKLTEYSTEEIKYTPVEGQKEDPKLGLYLDFEKADSPQPIRGNTGGTDPGPSMFPLNSEPPDEKYVLKICRE